MQQTNISVFDGNRSGCLRGAGVVAIKTGKLIAETRIENRILKNKVVDCSNEVYLLWDIPI
jgi:hypothetical protein